jgi:NAD(P)-dependent dehydrogenase (short-subunit alcohol dehydrogenase family)
MRMGSASPPASCHPKVSADMVAVARQHVVITGGGSGIGAAVAARLAGEGARLTLVGRRKASLEAIAGTCGHAVAISADVTDEAALAGAIEAARDAQGPVHALVASAGVADAAPIARTDIAMLRRMMAVNLEGVFSACRLVLPGMLEADFGRIVAVASTAGLKGYAYASAYAASKHAVIGLVRSLALEVATKGVTVNAVCPGYADTELTRESLARIMEKTGRSEEEARASLTAANPQKRLVSPEEVADAVCWLLGPKAAAVTGQSIAIAGGEVM